MVERHGHIVRILGDEADVANLSVGPIGAALLVYFGLEAVERQKIVAAQFRVGDQHIVIGIRHDRVAVGHIDLLNFLRSALTVGNGGVAVQIGFVEPAGVGNQILFQNDQSLLPIISLQP